MAEDKTLARCARGAIGDGAPPGGRGRHQAPHHGYGITKGTDIYVRKVAPLGDPIEVTVRGFELSLRKNEAQNVLVS